jgi:hypothetical protein
MLTRLREAWSLKVIRTPPRLGDVAKVDRPLAAA